MLRAAFRGGPRATLVARRFLSAAAAGQADPDFERRSRRAQKLFSVRRADERAQDGMEVWGMQNRRKRVGHDALAPARAEPLVKRPQDSLLTLMLPFKSDPKLRELYLNAAGHLRIGRLLEDFDSFAGQIAYTHCDDPDDVSADPVTLVTASLDRIDMVRPVPTDRDLMLRGCAAWVGTSSMAIVVSLSEIPEGLTASEAMAAATGHGPSAAGLPASAVEALGDAASVGGARMPPIVRADFTFVARDADDRAVRVPAMRPQTEPEVALFQAARDDRVTLKAARLATLDRLPPTPDELGMVHRLFADLRALRAAGEGPTPARQRHISDGAVYVGSTSLESTVVTFPTDRNIHGKAFGGWLLRNAFELAWAAALRFGGSTPEFVAMSDIAFLRPVEIGAVLSFRACVEYAQGAPHRTVSVCVETTSMDPRDPRAAQPTTNTFHFTFDFPDTAHNVPRAFPQSYEEAMAWVAAHRRRQAGMSLRSRWAMEGGEPPRV